MRTLWFRSREWRSYHVEGQTFRPDAEGYIEIPENLAVQIKDPTLVYIGRERHKTPVTLAEPHPGFASAAVDRDASTAGRNKRSAAPKLPRGGSRERSFWAEARAVAMRWLIDEGCPAPRDGRQVILEHHIDQWLDNHGHEASEPTIRRHVQQWIAERRAELYV